MALFGKKEGAGRGFLRRRRDEIGEVKRVPKEKDHKNKDSGFYYYAMYLASQAKKKK